MTLTISPSGRCQYDSSTTEWYGTCTFRSDKPATSERQTEVPDNQIDIYDIEGVHFKRQKTTHIRRREEEKENYN